MYSTLLTLSCISSHIYRHFCRWLGTREKPAGCRKVVTLPRVRSLDHTNPWKELRVAEKMLFYDAVARSTTPINFTSRSCVRPRQSMGRVANGADMLEKYATLPRVCAFDHANPWEELRMAPTCWKKMQLYLAFVRSTTLIHCNFRYVTPNGWKKMQLYLAFVRSTTPIHGNDCARRRKNVISRRVRALDHANPW